MGQDPLFLVYFGLRGNMLRARFDIFNVNDEVGDSWLVSLVLSCNTH